MILSTIRLLVSFYWEERRTLHLFAFDLYADSVFPYGDRLVSVYYHLDDT